MLDRVGSECLQGLRVGLPNWVNLLHTLKPFRGVRIVVMRLFSPSLPPPNVSLSSLYIVLMSLPTNPAL